LDFSLSDDQRDLQRATRDFATNELGSEFVDGELSHEGWKQCAAYGIQGMPVTTDFGGSGSDPLTIAIALEALGYGCRDNGLLFSLNAHMWSCEIPLVRFGSDGQKRRYLPGLVDGSLIGVQAMTEPDVGSDALSITTTARRRADRWVLSGAKTFITNAPVADVFVVFAATSDSPGIGRLTAFLIDRDAPGLTVGQPFHKMGLTTSPMSEVVFSGCELGSDALLGSEGAGFTIFNTSMLWERSLILATVVGTMQRQLDEAVAQARTRMQFGAAIGTFQAVSHRLADMKVRLEAARLLLYRQASELGTARPSAMWASIVKVFLSEAFLRSSEDVLQTFGAYGYMAEAGVERDVRDAYAARIYSGTSDIQRNIIAAHLGL
jgi:alkylation response protein AidB-like acyl-CoA dehydrogenase